MQYYLLTIVLSLFMGLSVFLSYPFVLKKNIRMKNLIIYNSVAAGILVFLLMDVYSDVAQIFIQSKNSSFLQMLFIVSFAVAFFLFHSFSRKKNLQNNPKYASFLAALGVGTQNLTEGLLFGSSAAAGLGSVWILTLVGFSIQNATEGFPIAAPLMFGNIKVEKKFVLLTFLLGALPTVIGTIIGLYYSSDSFIILFDSIACAAIVYVILMMISKNFEKNFEKDKKDNKLTNYAHFTYLGILLGFVIAYLVNYLV